MWCTICRNHLSDCICDDIDERLASIGSDHFVYKKCDKCKKHYDRCKCEKPEFIGSDDQSLVNTPRN